MRTEALAAASEAPAQVLAMIVAADSRVGERELRVLGELDAFRRLRVSRWRFAELGQTCLSEVGGGVCERSWLRSEELGYIDALLDAVSDPELRLLICRLAAEVVAADGPVSREEHRVYDHVLAYWRIGQDRVAQAILNDKVGHPA
jgi:hypothetical protein